MKKPVVAVIGASITQPGEPDYEAGIRLGRLLAESGIAVATGGYEGLMEAVSAGAAQVGGEVIGITAPAVFAGRSGANQHVTDERPAATLTERIHDLVSISDAVVALPGSLGTFTELVVAWNVAYVAPLGGGSTRPVIAVGPLWGGLVPLLAEQLGASADLVHCVDTVEQAAAAIVENLGS